MESGLFQLSNAFGFDNAKVDLRRVTLLIGSDDSGVIELGRAIVASNLSSIIKDPYLAFLRLFGVSPLQVMHSSTLQLDDVKLDIRENAITFKIGQPRWSHTVFMPSDRVGIIKLLLNVLETNAPTSYITLENVIEHVFSPIRFFLNTIVPPYQPAFTQEHCFKILLDKLKALKEKLGSAKTMYNSLIDTRLMSLAIEASKSGNVIYVEDPGIFKPVKKAKEYTQNMIMEALKRNVDVIIVTYRSAPLYAVSGLVEKGLLAASDVRAYHVRKEGEVNRVVPLTIEEGVGILPEDMGFIVEIMP